MSEPMSLHRPENVFQCCLKALLPFLKEFVYSHLERCYGPRYKERLTRPPSDSDTSAFLSIAIEYWDTVFRGHAPDDVKDYLYTIRKVRNRWAHGENVSDKKYLLIIDTIRLLAEEIGGDRAMAAFDHCFQPDSKPPVRPGPDNEPLDPRGLTYGDVINKKVFCPACIPNKVFKSWPMGWDAHAASASACRGLRETGPEARKKEFRSRFVKLFP